MRERDAPPGSPEAATSAVAVVLALVVAGCGNVHAVPVDPLTQSAIFVEIRVPRPLRVDLLFVVDNSDSMAEEQDLLVESAEVLIRYLVDPEPEPDPSGWPRAGLEDLRVGLVTTDLGTAGYPVQGCDSPILGEGGVLQRGGEGCAVQPAPWLSHSRQEPDDGTGEVNPPIWEDFRCLAAVGTTGCRIEQPLEAALMALTVQTEPGGPNEGFLREGSFIAVVFVTDEDDCSVRDPSLFDETREDLGPVATRCVRHEELLHPVSRYYDAFVALRPDDPGLVAVLAIAGVPIDGSWSPGDPIDRLRALRRFDPEDPDVLLPSCETAMGVAYPPPRIADLAYMFGNYGDLESVCRPDWTPALDPITRWIPDPSWNSPCLRREPSTTSAEDCTVVETLIDDRPCPHPAVAEAGRRVEGWHVDLGLDDDGRRACEILPADLDDDSCPDGPCDCDSGVHDGCLQGWLIRRRGDLCTTGEILFTSEVVTGDLSDIRLMCRTAMCPLRRQCRAAAGMAPTCSPDQPDSCPSGERCVRHQSWDICEEWGVCGRCSATVDDACPAGDVPDRWREEPLVEAGGCCHQGFHCDLAEGRCIPDRWLVCQ